MTAMSLLGEKTVGADDPTSTRRIKIGFLGASHSHASEKVRFAQGSALFDLVGICDDKDSVRERYRAFKVPLVSREELFAQAELIAVESDVKDHARDALLALKAGKHLHLEKPAADTWQGCKEIIQLARDRQRLLQLGYMWRFNPAINAVLEAARQGWLGQVYQVRGTINTQIPAEQRPTWAPFPGGSMLELGCHLIDPLVRLMGRPKAVKSTLHHHGAFKDSLVDNTVAIFEFEQAVGVISSATLQPDAQAHRSFEVLGANGTATVSPIEPPALRLHLAKAAGPYKAGSQTIAFPPYRRYAPELSDLADAIAKKRPLSVTLDEELLVQETLLRACEMI